MTQEEIDNVIQQLDIKITFKPTALACAFGFGVAGALITQAFWGAGHVALKRKLKKIEDK